MGAPARVLSNGSRRIRGFRFLFVHTQRDHERTALEQGQRRREASIRKNKRELAAAQLVAETDPSMESLAEVERLKGRLRERQADMRAYIDEANSRGDAPVLQRSPSLEWAGDMPRVRAKGTPKTEKASSRRVSSGRRISESFYDNEELWLSMDGEEVWHGEADVSGVEFPDRSELGEHRYSEVDARHTHTTSVGGTFSAEDIESMAALNLKSPRVTETLGERRTFVLERVGRPSKKTRQAFATAIKGFEVSRYQELCIEHYERGCMPHGLPMTQSDYAKADRALKAELHKWLQQNAIKYGYRYGQA